MVVTLNRLTSGNGGAGIYIVAFNIDTTVKNSDIHRQRHRLTTAPAVTAARSSTAAAASTSTTPISTTTRPAARRAALWNTNSGQVTIDDSTVNDNINNNAGADDLDGFGGGIYQADEDSLMTTRPTPR